MWIEGRCRDEIIWSFRSQVHAYSERITGIMKDKLGFPLGNFGFKGVCFV